MGFNKYGRGIHRSYVYVFHVLLCRTCIIKLPRKPCYGIHINQQYGPANKHVHLPRHF